MSDTAPPPAAAASAPTATKTKTTRATAKAAAASASAAPSPALAAAIARFEDDDRCRKFVSGRSLLPYPRRMLSTKAAPKAIPASGPTVGRNATLLRSASLLKRAHQLETSALLRRQQTEMSVHHKSHVQPEDRPDSDACNSSDEYGISLPDADDSLPEDEEKAARLRIPRLIRRAQRSKRREFVKRQKRELATLLQSYTPEELVGEGVDSEDFYSQSEEEESDE